MSETVGSFLRRAALAACLMLAASRAGAQQFAPPPIAVPPSTGQFFSRSDFHLIFDKLTGHDQRFVWDTHLGGDFDIVDYVHGRANVLVNYEAVLGKEFRPFDPNQGNYTLEASSSGRFGPMEVAGVFHHISRHLSDRPKRFAIAWNMLQVRLSGTWEVSGTTIDVRADAGKAVQHSNVDYAWTGDVEGRISRSIARHADLYVRAYSETFGVDHDISTRGRQTGGRVEGGLRLPGRGGAVELYLGYERMVDADPVEMLPISWGFAGFRLIGK